jgi:hypothetical protein
MMSAWHNNKHTAASQISLMQVVFLSSSLPPIAVAAESHDHYNV